MKIHQLHRVQHLPISIEEAWSFFSDPRNLPLITPPDLAFKVTSELPEKMYPGLIITYTLSPFPYWKTRWVTEITHAVEPVLFVDEQRFGPYSFWHHQHHFRATETGVEMKDMVSYSLPFFPLGELAAGYVARQLARIFDFRRDWLGDKLKAGGHPAASE